MRKVSLISTDSRRFAHLATMSFVPSNTLNLIDNNKKDGGCRFYQNALRSEIVPKGKIKSVEGRIGIRQQVIFFLLLEFQTFGGFS